MVPGHNSRPVSVRRVVSRFEDIVCESPRFGSAYGKSLQGPSVVAEIASLLIAHEAVEVFVVLLLNGRHRIVGVAEISRGTLTTSLVHPREVFGPALRLSSAAVIVVHNHPSGDPEPSAEDIDVTKRLKEVGKTLGVPLLDHIVIGEAGRYVSLRERLAF